MVSVAGGPLWAPLGDRELLLLAERGGLRKDDLLWPLGFELWKPVRSVCDLGATSNSAPAQQGATQDADDLTSDVTEATIAEPASNAMQAAGAKLEGKALRRAEKVPGHLHLSLAGVLRVPAARMGRVGWPPNQLQVLRLGCGERADFAKIMLIADAFGFAIASTTSR